MVPHVSITKYVKYQLFLNIREYNYLRDDNIGLLCRIIVVPLVLLELTAARFALCRQRS